MAPGRAVKWSHHACQIWPFDLPDPSALRDVTPIAVWLRLRENPGRVLYCAERRWLLLVGDRETVVTVFSVRTPGEQELINRYLSGAMVPQAQPIRMC